MSQFSTECVLCRDPVLHVFGWENGVSRNECVRAPWLGAGLCATGYFHFSCVQGWEHRDGFYAELVASFTDRDARIEVLDYTGALVTVRRSTPDRMDVETAADGKLILRDTEIKQWTVIDPEWGWAQISRRTALRLATGDRTPSDPGFARIFFEKPLPANAEELSLSKFLSTLGLNVRYPGLAELPYAGLEIEIVSPDRQRALVAVTVPDVVPEWVSDHFQALLAAQGESAFAADELADLPDDL
jgi:hypothetical protein